MSFGAATAEDIAPLDTPVSGTPHAVAPFGEADRNARKAEVADTAPSGEPVSMRATVNGTAVPPPAAAGTPAPAAAPARDRPLPKLPISTAPDSLPPPKDENHQGGPSPACPQCESPMAWVEEHLRFYCKSCRMYF